MAETMTSRRPSTRSSTWEDLAAGANLPAAVAMDIWAHGDDRARIRLAAARDLPEEIQEAIATSGETTLLESWLNERRRGKLLRCVDPGLSEHLRRHLALQPEAEEDERRAVAAFGEEHVLRALLTRPDLTHQETHDYLVAYVSQCTIRRDSYGATLIGMIGEQPETWIALLDCIGPNQSGILVEAARRHTSAELHQKTAKMLWRMSGKADARELLRAGESLLASPWLDEEAYCRLAEIPELTSIRPALWARGAIDVPGLLHTIEDCDSGRGCDDGTHGAAVTELARRVGATHLPVEQLARAAVRHHHETEAAARETIYATLPGEATERVAGASSAAGAHHEAARVIAAGRQSIQKIHPDTLKVLAARGSAHALGRDDDEEMELVLRHYQPLRDVVKNPRYAGLLAGHVAELRDEERETFYRLLWEWETDLPALLDAAHDL
jgi:hypothetical protein